MDNFEFIKNIKIDKNKNPRFFKPTYKVDLDSIMQQLIDNGWRDDQNICINIKDNTHVVVGNRRMYCLKLVANYPNIDIEERNDFTISKSIMSDENIEQVRKIINSVKIEFVEPEQIHTLYYEDISGKNGSEPWPEESKYRLIIENYTNPAYLQYASYVKEYKVKLFHLCRSYGLVFSTIMDNAKSSGTLNIVKKIIDTCIIDFTEKEVNTENFKEQLEAVVAIVSGEALSSELVNKYGLSKQYNTEYINIKSEFSNLVKHVTKGVHIENGCIHTLNNCVSSVNELLYIINNKRDFEKLPISFHATTRYLIEQLGYLYILKNYSFVRNRIERIQDPENEKRKITLLNGIEISRYIIPKNYKQSGSIGALIGVMEEYEKFDILEHKNGVTKNRYLNEVMHGKVALDTVTVDKEIFSQGIMLLIENLLIDLKIMHNQLHLEV